MSAEIKPFEKELEVRWVDCDANRHVRHSAYYDYGAHARIRFFAEMGFGSSEMAQLSIGPILFKEECSFIRELKVDDVITVNLLKGKLTHGGARWELHHEIFNAEGKKAAHITIRGAWMDLKARKLTTPPEKVGKLFDNLPQCEPYSYVKSS